MGYFTADTDTTQNTCMWRLQQLPSCAVHTTKHAKLCIGHSACIVSIRAVDCVSGMTERLLLLEKVDLLVICLASGQETLKMDKQQQILAQAVHARQPSVTADAQQL